MRNFPDILNDIQPESLREEVRHAFELKDSAHKLTRLAFNAVREEREEVCSDLAQANRELFKLQMRRA